MWQRVQTLYLAIAAILIGVMFFSVKAVTVGADGLSVQTYRFTAYLPYLILLILITGLNLLALGSFKIRVFQYRTTVLAALLTLALQVWLVVDFIFTHDTVVFKVAAVFPVIALIFQVLAARGILADQLMVESADHLRKSRRERRR